MTIIVIIIIITTLLFSNITFPNVRDFLLLLLFVGLQYYFRLISIVRLTHSWVKVRQVSGIRKQQHQLTKYCKK
jgi:hypothetical protein